MQAIRAIVAALAWALTASVWAQDAQVVDQAEKLLQARRYAEAFRLLEPLEDRLAGDVRYDYLLARSALESGNPSRASFIYERILAVEPNYVGVRLEMGRAYLAMGDYARAKLEFETLLRIPNLPADLRQQVLIYERLAVERSQPGSTVTAIGYLEYGFGYDSNAQSSTSVSPITTSTGQLILPGGEISDHYHALSAGGELGLKVTEQLSAFVGTDLRLREYRDVEDAGYGTIDGRFGVDYSGQSTQTRFGVALGRYYQNDRKTRDNAGLTFDLRTMVNRTNQLSFGMQLTRYEFQQPTLATQDYDLAQGTIGWLKVVNEGRGAVGLSLLAGVERAEAGREDGDKPFAGARLTLQNSLTETVGAFFLAGAQHGKYKEFNVAFGGRREDTLYDVAAGITWTFASGWSLRPQLVYLKNDSNLPIFEYEKTDLSINVRKDF